MAEESERSTPLKLEHQRARSDTAEERDAASKNRAGSARVCDRCIRKKTKCNQATPACSRCIEAGEECRYSAVKKRPGPLPGAKQRRKDTFRQRNDPKVKEDSQQTPEAQSASPAPKGTDLLDCSVTEAPFGLIVLNEKQTVEGWTILQERELLDLFFTNIHSAIRLFDSQKFLVEYEANRLDDRLLKTILCITTLILKRTSQGKVDLQRAQDVFDANQRYVFDSRDRSEDFNNIQFFQNACLIAYFRFHQTPGQEAWLMISTLSRRAYRLGLHQLDNDDQMPAILFSCATEEDKETWRRCWWFVAAMDSYSNMAAGTPCNMERASTRTALLRPAPTSIVTERLPPLFLDDSEVLWKVVKETISRGVLVNENLYIVTGLILNEAAEIQRLLNQNPSVKLYSRLAAMEDHISTFRLALPTEYLYPARNVMINESMNDYYARLICILHLHTARLMLLIPPLAHRSEAERLMRWQRRREVCGDIVAIFRQWDNSNSAGVDPSVCVIAYAALAILEVHSRCHYGADASSAERIKWEKTVLTLFLDQFGFYWKLPAHLQAVFQISASMLPPVLEMTDVDLLMRTFRPPLHQMWTSILESRVAPDHTDH